jgi:hypothetical protein
MYGRFLAGSFTNSLFFMPPIILLAVRLGPRRRRCAEHFPLARGPIGGLLDIHEAREIGRPCGQLCRQGLPTCHRQTDSRMVEWPADLGSEQDELSDICEVAHVTVQERHPNFQEVASESVGSDGEARPKNSSVVLNWYKR